MVTYKQMYDFLLIFKQLIDVKVIHGILDMLNIVIIEELSKNYFDYIYD